MVFFEIFYVYSSLLLFQRKPEYCTKELGFFFSPHKWRNDQIMVAKWLNN